MLKPLFLYFVFSSVLVSCGVIKKKRPQQKSSYTAKNIPLKTKHSKTSKKDFLFFRVPKNKVGRYIKRYGKIAMEQMQHYKIPASITIAQGILESNSGKSILSRESNNHFGIKCHKKWKGDFVRYNDDKPKECFRKYKDAEESYHDHSRFLIDRKRYHFLFKKSKIDNYRFWAKGLKKAGYATDPKYADKLITLIERYDLHILDVLVKKGIYKKVVFLHAEQSKKKQKKYTHTVQKGDTLYSIAKKYGMTVEKLKDINDFFGDITLSIDQVLKIK